MHLAAITFTIMLFMYQSISFQRPQTPRWGLPIALLLKRHIYFELCRKQDFHRYSQTLQIMSQINWIRGTCKLVISTQQDELCSLLSRNKASKHRKELCQRLEEFFCAARHSCYPQSDMVLQICNAWVTIYCISPYSTLQTEFCNYSC